MLARCATRTIVMLASVALIVGWADRVCVSASAPSVQCFEVQTCCGEPIQCQTSNSPIVNCLFFPRPLIRRWPAVVKFENQLIGPSVAALRFVAVATHSGARHRPMEGAPRRAIASTLVDLSCLLLE